MSDSLHHTELQYERGAVTPNSLRSEHFAHASLMGGRTPARKAVTIVVALALLFFGVMLFFAALRLLFDPYILGGPSMVVVAVPLIVIACIALIYLGTRMLIRGARHSRH
jgi:hypothetical protein